MEGTSFTSTICDIFEIAKVFKTEHFTSINKFLILHTFKIFQFRISAFCNAHRYELFVMSASDYLDFNRISS